VAYDACRTTAPLAMIPASSVPTPSRLANLRVALGPAMAPSRCRAVTGHARDDRSRPGAGRCT
jgi:hypothetical protein